MSVIETARNFLFRRQFVYQQVFNRDNVYLTELLEDLAKFCRAHETTFHPDPRVNSVLEGRREVWLRIQNHLNLTQEELWKIHSAKKGPTES